MWEVRGSCLKSDGYATYWERSFAERGKYSLPQSQSDQLNNAANGSNNSSSKSGNRFSSPDRQQTGEQNLDLHEADNQSRANYSQPLSSNYQQNVGTLFQQQQIDLKVFVGQIPKQWEENELKAFFEKYGEILKVQILRDKDRGHKGCGFVVFASILAANQAIEGLKTYKLPGMQNSIQIRWADNEIDRLGIRQDQENTLYVAQIPKNILEAEIREVFSKYGNVKEVNIPRDQAGWSRGYIFIKYSNLQESIIAKQNLHDTFPFQDKSQAIVIRFYDPKKKANTYSSGQMSVTTNQPYQRRDHGYPAGNRDNVNRRSRSRERSTNHSHTSSYTRGGDDYYNDQHGQRGRDNNYQNNGYQKTPWGERDHNGDTYRQYDNNYRNNQSHQQNGQQSTHRGEQSYGQNDQYHSNQRRTESPGRRYNTGQDIHQGNNGNRHQGGGYYPQGGNMNQASTYQAPVVAPQAPAPVVQQSQAQPKVYYQYFTADKIPYYFDTVTQETSYDLPPTGSMIYQAN